MSAGQNARPGSKTELLLKAIDTRGGDKFGNPIGIRGAALSEATGVPIASIPILLSPYVQSGRLCVCKVTVPGTPPQNEWRTGGGKAIPEFKLLNIKRKDIAHGTAPAVAPSKKPQPAVGNTGSTRSDSSVILSEARAVAADQATPKSEARVRMKKEPAATRASAGDATVDDNKMRVTITSEGVLDIVLPEFDGLCDSVQLNPEQVLHLGDFLHQTEGVWRP